MAEDINIFIHERPEADIVSALTLSRGSAYPYSFIVCSLSEPIPMLLLFNVSYCLWWVLYVFLNFQIKNRNINLMK